MLLLLFSLMVHAQETLPSVNFVQGSFQSQGAYLVQSHQRSEEVEIKTAEGQRRLEELLTEGYKCNSKSEDQSLCLKSLQVAGGVHPGLNEAVESLWKGQVFSFEKVVGDPEISTNTEFYKQWDVPQKAVLWEIPEQKEKQVWNPISYAWMQGDWYVYLGSFMSPLYFSMKIENETLKLSDKIEIQKGPVTDRYFVQVVFEKLQKQVMR